MIILNLTEALQTAFTGIAGHENMLRVKKARCMVHTRAAVKSHNAYGWASTTSLYTADFELETFVPANCFGTLPFSHDALVS